MGPCEGCRFWQEGCRLIRQGRVGELLDAGSCRPWGWIERWIGRFVRLFHPEAASEEEDLLQELQLGLRQPDFRLPSDLVPDAAHLRPYLRSAVLNRASDFLRRERLAPKVRCGACRYRGATGRCDRSLIVNGSGVDRPNPHYGRELEPGANPRALQPPCNEFFWRYRPVGLDEIDERRKIAGRGEGCSADERAGVLALALGELMRAGPPGRRQALMLKEHFLAGTTAKDIAGRLGVNERTVRRAIGSGLASLRLILREKLRVSEEDLL